MIRYVPNTLTIIRIVLVPVFVWLAFFYPPHRVGLPLALAVFIIATATDWLDGKLARKYGIITNFGKIMDPLADKILVTAALLALALPPLQAISMWVVGVIVTREVVVTIMRQHYAHRNVYIAANIWGKLKTFMQMLGAVAALAYFSALPWWEPLDVMEGGVRRGVRVYFWIVVAVTVLSGMNYFIRSRPRETAQ